MKSLELLHPFNQRSLIPGGGESTIHLRCNLRMPIQNYRLLQFVDGFFVHPAKRVISKEEVVQGWIVGIALHISHEQLNCLGVFTAVLKGAGKMVVAWVECLGGLTFLPTFVQTPLEVEDVTQSFMRATIGVKLNCVPVFSFCAMPVPLTRPY